MKETSAKLSLKRAMLKQHMQSAALLCKTQDSKSKARVLHMESTAIPSSKTPCCITCCELCPAAVPLDCDICLVSYHMCVGEDEAVADDKACACALTLGVVLPGEEVIGPGGGGRGGRR